MEVLEIREDAARERGAILRADGYEPLVTVRPLFDADRERELDWYFEEHLRFPFTDQVRARTAGASAADYGHALFSQLFQDRQVYAAYDRLRTRIYPSGLEIHIVGSPAFQALHWEALKDPDLDRPFALDCPMVRRRLGQQPPLEAQPKPSPTLNLLVVTARLGGAHDVGYRTVTRPLVETLRQAKLRVAVDLVRRGTWRALRSIWSAPAPASTRAVLSGLRKADIGVSCEKQADGPSLYRAGR